MSNARPPITVAVDASSVPAASALAAAVSAHVSTIKLGLEFFCAQGPEGVAKVMASLESELFLDLKLHDIPNTVSAAAREAAKLSPTYLTVHASGGPAMIAAAVDAAPEVKITAVTILTSLSAEDLALIGYSSPPLEAVVRLARLAVDAGARALVCSPQEVAAVRRAVGSDITLLTPGVRPAGADIGDQARIATPEQALKDGADQVIIGRPITESADPGAAAAAIAASIMR